MRGRSIVERIPLSPGALTLALCGCAAAQPASADAPARDEAAVVEYVVSLPAPQTQTVEISMRIDDVDTAALDVRLPAWRPGRYQILDPSGTVRAVHAYDGQDRALPIEKTDKATWRVQTQGARSVRIDSTIYANSAGDRTRHVDDTHAFLSGSAVFFYVEDRRDAPVRVRVVAPPDWRIATGLEPDPARPRTVTAPSYDVLVDSPLEIGLHDLIEFEVDGVPHEIAIWPPGLTFDAERLKEDFAAIVQTQAAVFGDLPYRRFVFLIHAGVGGGGTEHLNSTIMQTSRAALEGSVENDDSYQRFLGLVAHEMFHTWNVKQLRPSGIHPYDYARENYSRLFWVAEGTTSYYDPVTLVRAGLRKPDRYLRDLAGSIDSFRRRPGRGVQSLEESSFDAWIKFNHGSPDDVNTEVSFYRKGALVSLMLDMEIRRRTGNEQSLDAVLRTMYERFPLSGPGYDTDDLLATLAELTGTDFDGFFDAYVRGTDALALAEALVVAGLELFFKPTKKEESTDGEGEEAAEDGDDGTDDEDQDATDDEEEAPPRERAYLGLNLSGGSPARVRSVLADGPAYLAGIITGDEIVALDGRRLSGGELDRRLKKREPGEPVEITYFRRDELRTVRVVLGGQPDGKWSIRRVKEPSDQQRIVYESWLGQPWPGTKEKDVAEDAAAADAPEPDGAE